MAVFANKSVTRRRNDYPKVLEYADENRKENFFVDVTVAADKVNIQANRLVLSCCSKVFERMFKTQMKEHYERTINITAVDGKSVKTLIDFMYSGSITINSKNVLQLLAAADYLQMEEIKTFCAEFLESILTPASCYTILGAANLYRLESIQKLAYQMISTEFDKFVKTDDFKSFSKDDVKNCISKLNRAQVKEVSVYKAIITWTKNDQQNRARDFADLFHMVHLDNLPRQFLYTSVSTEELVSENLTCSKLLTASLCTLLNQKHGNASKILSFGGEMTPGKVIEVYNCDDTITSNYNDLAKDINGGWALKHHNQIYYVGSGLRDSSNRLVSTNYVAKLKLEGNTATSKHVAPINTIRKYFAAAVFCDALVVSSFDAKKCSPSAECYIPSLSEWILLEAPNIAKDCNVLVPCEDCLYDVGGFDGRRSLTTVERLCGLKEKWKFVRSMQTDRSGHAAVAWNGQIYVFGGRSCKNDIGAETKSAERYNPSSDNWCYVKEMNFARSGHVACVLRDKIYVVGGKDAQNHCVREIECYDPDSDTWSIVGVTPVDLNNHSILAV